MAKKKQQKVVEAEPVPDSDEDNNEEDDDDEDYEEDELELLQVDLGDMVKVKQVLDEAVASVVLEKLDEDYHWDNLKLVIMALACTFAMVAQFAPVPFPDSRPLLGVCGCSYFLLSGVLQLIATFIDKDAILLTQPLHPGKANGSDGVLSDTKNGTLKKHGIRVRSNMPRFSEWYTVILEFKMDGDQAKVPHVEKKWSVGQFFDKEGFFDEFGLMKEVENLYGRLERADYDKAASEKKNQ